MHIRRDTNIFHRQHNFLNLQHTPNSVGYINTAAISVDQIAQDLYDFSQIGMIAVPNALTEEERYSVVMRIEKIKLS
ncbi:hypothetical protein COV18_03095 [Candidatus Woesearchaeota archaeon CG10_big_fil_rev_8_21_14_0_10_37_12]|nr:MAG: hypothetical protein COV18_03095 [Candidatus Woesearchaeota archaeon CG10_big_fil_rev_8_21_14_0_10_37_12]